MAIGVVTGLWYEMWFRDSACKFLWGKNKYFSSYLIIERSDAFKPVTLRGEPGTNPNPDLGAKALSGILQL